MPQASYVQSAFIGGEWSQTAQGNIADPKYRVAMNVCLNGYPTAQGAWVRRSGFLYCGTTRGGVQGREISFDFQQATPYRLEFTAGFIRARSNGQLTTTNDSVTITSISTANPASVQLSAAMPSGWATGNSFFFSLLGSNNPLLQNRVFTGTKVDSTHVTIADAITGATIDGSTLGTFVSGTFNRIQEIVAPYVGTDWQSLQLVQTNSSGLLLQGLYQPRILTVTVPPNNVNYAQFALNTLTFLDGPYLDPPTNGAQLAASGQTGITNLTLSFAAWSSTAAYKVGDLVIFSSVVYQSLAASNVNNEPDISPSFWATVSAGVAIPGGQGFQASDVGRLIRLFSEPPLWVSGTAYTANSSFVSLLDADGNPSYWQCLTSISSGSTNAVMPGTDTTHWGIATQGATWTWGRVTGLLNMISGTLASSANIGSLTGNGGLSAAFDGNLTKASTACAEASTNAGIGPGGTTSFSCWVGKDYHSSTPSSFAIQFASLFPSSNKGMFMVQNSGADGASTTTWTINLRAKNTSPASQTDGTILGTYTNSQFNGLPGADNPSYNQTSGVTIISTDQVTTYKYVWFDIQISLLNQSGQSVIQTITTFVAQAEFFNAASGGSTGVSVELLGGSLQYGANVRTWRLGLFTGTNWPTCGTWHEGRLWLSGSVANRIDASVPGTLDTTLNTISFAPTAPNGAVLDSSAIDYTFDAEDVNTVFWMQQDQQGIICGTLAAEWLVQATSLNQALTALNIQAHRVTKIGCANILPRRAEHTLVFVQKHGRKLVEYFADVFSGKFTAPDLSEKSKHLTVSGIAEIAYQQELTPIVWARRADGTLIGMTYRRDTLMTSQGPTFSGWHRHALGSGRIVEGICVGASSAGTLDALSCVTNDTATGIRHVELMTDQWEEGDLLPNAWFLDDAVTPTSSATGTLAATGAPCLNLYGLWHLNGKTATAFVGGLDAGDWPVTNGQMQVPFAASTQQTNALFTSAFVSGYVGTLPIVVGFTYTTQGQPVAPQEPQQTGARNGPAFGKIRRAHKYAADLVDTQGIAFATNFSRTRTAQLRTVGQTPIAANALFNGILQDANLNDDYTRDGGRVGWQVTRPFPATVAAICAFLETQDE